MIGRILLAAFELLGLAEHEDLPNGHERVRVLGVPLLDSRRAERRLQRRLQRIEVRRARRRARGQT